MLSGSSHACSLPNVRDSRRARRSRARNAAAMDSFPTRPAKCCSVQLPTILGTQWS